MNSKNFTQSFIKGKIVCILFLIFTFWLPTHAFAYLDPGSGSALFTSIIAIVTAGLYTVKMLYYKLLGKKDSSGGVDNQTVVIFSEGKSYWATFEPIVRELISRKVYFRYISIDMFDPALEIENEYMHSKLYSKNASGFGKIAAIQAPLMLATTPNIGSDGYPLPRPKKVVKLVHIFHDFVAGANYSLGGLDDYDIVISTGEYAEKYIRHSEEVRKAKHKEIIALGLPYLDTLKNKLASEGLTCSTTSVRKTILIAPSWGSKGCFNFFGVDFVKELLRQDKYDIIIRLHPHSYIHEPDNVQHWKNEIASAGNVAWDEGIYSTHAMQSADILISDTSSVRFDFAFLHLKPVITLFIPQESRSDFEACYHDTTWDVEIAPQIGAVVEKDSVHLLSQEVAEVLSVFNADVLTGIRDKNIVHFGNASKHIVDFLQEKVLTS